MSRERIAMVTGGTRGIGRGIVYAMLRAGYKVVVCSRTSPCHESMEKEFAEQGLPVPLYVEADVSNFSAMQTAVKETVEKLGHLHVMCANAGVFPSASLEEMTPEFLDNILDVNLKGTFFSVQAGLPELKKANGGRIIITSSITGPITGYAGWSAYAATKAAQLGFIRTAAIELAPFGITVNAILPGNILTEGLEAMGSEYIAGMVKSIPMGRLGTVEDIGELAVFLAGGTAGYITGQTIVVDGGQVLPESLDAQAK